MRIETLTAHAAHSIDPTTRAIATPIYLSTTFERAVDGSFPSGYTYIRENNPNRAALEECYAVLEGGEAALAFSSGMAATNVVFQALTPADHVIAPHDSYYGTGGLLRDVFATWGLQATFVDMSNLAEVQEAVRPNTRLIWTETPSNPLLKITDLRRVAEIARNAGAISVCDNTWATALLQRPLDLGIDIVMHSTTKYLGGHSDVMGGALIAKTDSEFFEKIRKLQKLAGAIPSPFDCWLILRGIQTLPYRMRGHCENAVKVAQFLAEHSGVEKVHYPGLKTHPGYEVAASQMSQPGGMLSFQVKGGYEEAMAMAGRLKIFTRATSLGGTVSLIEHRASIEGPHSRAPQNLLRVSIGLEHPDDLIEDLAQALG
jgi:cystathionine gamma-synthase